MLANVRAASLRFARYIASAARRRCPAGALAAASGRGAPMLANVRYIASAARRRCPAGALAAAMLAAAGLAAAGLARPCRVPTAAWQGPPCRLWQGPPEDLWQGPIFARSPPAPPEAALGPAAAVVWGLGGLAAALAQR